MERILVSMHGAHGSWAALSRAVSLAKRIDAWVYVLLVRASSARKEDGLPSTERTMRRQLELFIESAKAEGIHIDQFVAEGAYEEEVIHFVDNHRITILVAETGNGDGRSGERESASLRKIRHRISCRVELVSPRKNEN